MKFQKSFFRHESWEKVVSDALHFFTKQFWPDGRESTSLVSGFPELPPSLGTTRRVTRLSTANLAESVSTLQNLRKRNELFDFVFLDTRDQLATPEAVNAFLNTAANEFFQELRAVVRPGRYCGLVVDSVGPEGRGHTGAWALAAAASSYFRLRDERIGIRSQRDPIYYCLFLQADEDIPQPNNPIEALPRFASAHGFEFPSWIIPKPPPRRKGELLHPAKFPETLVADFIQRFSRPGEAVLDPMMGTASTLLAAIRTNRIGYGVELSPHFFNIAVERISAEEESLFPTREWGTGYAKAILGDAMHLASNEELASADIRYCITSPPYWSMLSNPGSENQRARRAKGLPTVYSDNARDLGNIDNYEVFLAALVSIYAQVAQLLARGSVLTVIVKNVKREHVIYPLAWDLVNRLCAPGMPYSFLGNTMWCQDDVALKPFAVGTHWVSNTVHQYCLHLLRIDE